MRIWKLIAFMLSVGVMFIDGGDGGGSDGGGDNGAGGTGGADGGAGNGGETLLAGKYKTQDELVTGYTELQTAFSGKDEVHKADLAKLNSPESYEAGEGWGNDNAMDNRMMAVFQEVGKEHNMPQGMYESLFNGMVDMQNRVSSEALAETQKSIPNFDNRSNAIADTALRFLRPDQASALDSLLTSKESFEAVELLMGQLRGGVLPTNTAPTGEVDSAELRSQLRKLNPADSKERERLLGILNAQGDGEGTMV